jgi:hypothetical protein
MASATNNKMPRIVITSRSLITPDYILARAPAAVNAAWNAGRQGCPLDARARALVRK